MTSKRVAGHLRPATRFYFRVNQADSLSAEGIIGVIQLAKSYVFFSRSGFTPPARRLAQSQGALLVDLLALDEGLGEQFDDFPGSRRYR